MNDANMQARPGMCALVGSARSCCPVLRVLACSAAALGCYRSAGNADLITACGPDEMAI